MGKIHVNRNRQMLGQFTSDEVEDGLKSGQFLPDDLAWREPMETWKPLSEFSEFSTPVEDPAAVIEEAPPLIEPAWERRQELGFFKAVTETVWKLLSAPTVFFQNLKLDGGFGAPLAFYIIVGWITQSVALGYSEAINMVSVKFGYQRSLPHFPEPWNMLIHHPAVFIPVIPVMLVFSVFVSAGLHHLCLMVLGAANKPFQATFRVCAYVAASASVFLLIPSCGSFAATIYILVLLCIGLREVHQTTYPRAVSAVLIPMAFCCALFLGDVAFLSAMHGFK